MKTRDLSPTELRELKEKDRKRLRKEQLAANEELHQCRDELLGRDDVTCVHVGLKKHKGQFAYPLQIALCIHVEHKRKQSDKNLVNPFDPSDFTVPIDVVESSFDASLDCSSPDRVEWKRRRDPIQGGCAVGREGATNKWGTLGLVVKLDGKPYFLTNRHVAGKKGKKIYQPPADEHCREVIGEVAKAPPISSEVDCALIKPNNSRAIKGGLLGVDSTNVVYAIWPQRLNDDHESAEVFFVGAKSGSNPMRTGQIESVNASVKVKNVGTFHGQILVENTTPGHPLIDGGDSGSVLVSSIPIGLEGLVPRFIIGLVHGRDVNSGKLVASHIREVQRELGKFDLYH